MLKPSFVAGLPRASSRRWRGKPASAGQAFSCRRPMPRAGASTMRWRCSRAAPSDRPLQARPAELRGVRREAGVRRRPGAGADRVPRRAARRADLRGHLDRRSLRDPGRDRRRAAARSQWLALRGRQAGHPAVDRGRPDHRDRAAARLSQPGRRPGRAGVRRRQLRPQCRPDARLPDAGVQGGCRHHPLGPARRRLADRAWRRRTAARRRGGGVAGDRARHPRLCPQERLPRRGARPFRRHRFGGGGRACRRCPRARPGPLRDDALSLHGGDQPRGCRGLCQGARLPLRHRADRRARSRRWNARSRRCSRGVRPT